MASIVLPLRSFIPAVSPFSNNISSSCSITDAPSSVAVLDTSSDQGYIIHMGTDCTMCKHYAKVERTVLGLALMYE